MIITAPFEPVTILPIGTVLMYHGAGINNVAGRSLPLGLDPLDTIGDIPYGGWYCCNGNSGTPHLLNYMIRSEAVSGNTGGSDTHILTVPEMPSHDHGSETGGVSNQAGTNAGRDYHTSGYGTGFDYSSIWAVVSNRFLAHAHSIGAQGGGGAHNNMPAYFSLIFIIRIT